jgi:hypothetical protein
MAITAIGGGDLDNVYKSGLVGLGSGAFTASGGFGMVNAWGSKSKALQFTGRQLYQGIGTAGRSIGNNWAMGRDPFSRVTVGTGPVNITFGKGQKLLQWQNNIGNIGTNLFGLTNLAFGGSADFNWEHLTPTYGSGLIDKFFGGTWGAHSILYRTDQYDQDLISHELHHIWQSRAFGDAYLANYAGQGLLGLLMGRPFSFVNSALHPNYFENQAYYFKWFGR